MTFEDLMSILGPFATHTNTDDQSLAVVCYPNGLNKKWRGRTMSIPPVGKEHDYISQMINHGNGIVLVKAKTNKPWIQDLLKEADGTLFIEGNLPHQKDGPTIGSGTGYVMSAFGIENLNKIKRTLELKIIKGQIVYG